MPKQIIQNSLMALAMERWNVILLSIFPAFINFCIMIYAILKSVKTRAISYFLTFILTLIIWQFAEGAMRMSVDENSVTTWHEISQLSILFVVFFGSLFIFRYTGLYKQISPAVIYLVYLLPLIFFFIAINFRYDTFSIKQSETWYWIVNPLPGKTTTLISIWISLGALVMLSTLWHKYVTTSKPIEKQKYFLLAAGFSFPVIGGIVTEIIFPLLFEIDNIPATTSLVTTFSISAIIAITKYEFLNYSPKHQWNNIVEELNDGIVIVNEENKIMYSNPAFSKLMGYGMNEIIGMNVSQILNKKGKPKLEDLQEDETVIEGKKNQVALIAKDGSVLWTMFSGSPYTDHRGKKIGFIGLFTNVTHFINSEKSLKAANEDLEIYIYKSSHDLRGPLASILGLLLVSDNEIQSDNPAYKYLKMIEKSAKKLDIVMVNLVNGMKITGVKTFDEEINFEALINSILDRYVHVPEANLMEKNIEIKVSGSFRSNAFLVETILQNLIDNAIKYRNTNNRKHQLKIIITKASGFLDINVSDTGMGIDNVIKDRVYDMYFRGTNERDGTGLGLYLVKKCIEKLNGEIYFESSLGLGSSFYVRLKAKG